MEKFDILNPDGTPTGRVKERSLVHRDGDLHGTVHIWLARKNPFGRWEILLQKRSDQKDSFPGCYDISSAGHIPAGEGFLDSAMRELKEELGICADPEELCFVGMHRARYEGEFHGKPWNNDELSAVYVLYRDIDTSEMQIQREELSGVRWMEYENCLENLHNPKFPNCIFEDELKMLGVYLNGKRDQDQCHADSGSQQDSV